MDTNTLVVSLGLIFFTAALFFWTYAWWHCDRVESLLALRFAVVFEVAGCCTLVLWRVITR